MNTLSTMLASLAVLGIVALPSPATAQGKPAAAVDAPSKPDVTAVKPGWTIIEEPNPERGEPNVRHVVIEGEATRIDELKVRGTTTRITVTSKIGPKQGYEIITGDGSRDLSDGANTSRGAAGKRVWNVLSF